MLKKVNDQSINHTFENPNELKIGIMMFPKEVDVSRSQILPSLKSFVTYTLELNPNNELKRLPQTGER